MSLILDSCVRKISVERKQPTLCVPWIFRRILVKWMAKKAETNESKKQATPWNGSEEHSLVYIKKKLRSIKYYMANGIMREFHRTSMYERKKEEKGKFIESLIYLEKPWIWRLKLHCISSRVRVIRSWYKYIK